MALPLVAFTPERRDWEPVRRGSTSRAFDTSPRKLFFLDDARPRPTTVPRKPVYGDGDLLVVQVGSAAGATEKQKRILRSLGLGRVGKRRRHHGFEGAELRQIWIIQHLLEVLPVVSYDPTETDRDVSAMNTHSYAIDNRPAVRIDYDRGEYLQAELHDKFFSMAWTSEQSAAAFVRAAAQMFRGLETASGHAVVLAEKDSEYVDRTIQGALKQARWDASVLFLRLDFPGVALTWSTNADDDNPQGNVPIGQAGLISERYDGEDLVRILHGTASGQVAKLAGRLIQKELDFLGGGVAPAPVWIR